MRWAAGAIARRPGLWLEAVRAFFALSPDRWWRTRPFIPRVDPDYSAWRIATAYGTETATPTADDLVGYLVWRRAQRKTS